MAVIRGKLFTDLEVVPHMKTIGEWPFEERDGRWFHRDGIEYIAVPLNELLAELEKDGGWV